MQALSFQRVGGGKGSAGGGAPSHDLSHYAVFTFHIQGLFIWVKLCSWSYQHSRLLTVATHSWSSAVKDVTAPIIINKASAHLGPFLPDGNAHVVLHWPVSVCVLDLHPEDPTLYTTVISHNIREVDSVPLSLQHSAGLTLKTLNQPKLLMFQEFHLCRQHIHVWSEASKQSGLSEHDLEFSACILSQKQLNALEKEKISTFEIKNAQPLIVCWEILY